MGSRLNRLDEPSFMAVSKPLLTEFGIHPRLEIELDFSASWLSFLSCCWEFSSRFLNKDRSTVGFFPTDFR